MITNRRRHRVPGLNTSSTADISFMLLIFFLVTTSMDVDKGLKRQLPPEDKQKQQVTTNVEKSNLMTLRLDAANQLLVNDKPTDIRSLRRQVVDFVRQRGRQHLISLESDRDASYDVYFHIQNELVAAYTQLRNDKAREMYHRNFNQLSSDQKKKLNDLCPQRIAESYANAALHADSIPVEKGGKE